MQAVFSGAEKNLVGRDPHCILLSVAVGVQRMFTRLSRRRSYR